MAERRFLWLGVLAIGLAAGCQGPQPADEPVEAIQQAVTTTLFKPYAVTATGSFTAGVAIGDLNGDGRADVAITTTTYSDPANDNRLHVFLQAPDGTLQPRVKYSLGSRPESIDIGDVNGDGRADVVVGNFNGASVGVLLQTAGGTLDPMVAYPTVNSLSIKIGDFNSDGRMDVVGINWGGSGDGVDVFLQTAAGTLAPPVTYHAVHGGYDEVDVGDVNGDGRTDIVIMSGQGYAEPNLQILLQRPDGTMGAPTPYRVPLDSTGYAQLTHGVGIGDINGDALQDVVVSYGTSSDAMIGRFLQNAQGTLNPVLSSTTWNGTAEPVVLADVDGDGRKDVITVHSGAKVGVYRQTSGGGIATEEEYLVPFISGHRQPQGLAAGDINGDGLTDLAIANAFGGLVTLLHVDDVLPTVSLTAPSGGSKVTGLPVEVSWTAGDNAALAGFDLAVSSDGGASWSAIAGCTGLPAEARTCVWSSPGPAAAGTRIRVTARDTSGNQAEAETAVDLVAPALTVTAPGAGETWYRGTSRTITWSDNLPDGDTVRIELSRDGGGSYETLATAAPNTGGFAWTVSEPVASSAVVRISCSAGASTATASSGAFQIVAPTVNVTAPGAGTSWFVGTAMTIAWTGSLPAGDTMRIDLSRDGGGTFETLAAAAPNSGSFAWVVTGPVTAGALVRVSSNGSGIASDATGLFSIVLASVAVSSPAEGAAWLVGTTHTITWSDDLPAADTMRIELSRDGGASYETLAAAVPNTGSFTWTVGSAASANARVRVAWNGPAPAAASSATFTIAVPAIAVTAPVSDDQWMVGSQKTITWFSNLPANETLSIELSRNGGSSYELLAAAAPNTGSFAWAVTGSASTNALVRLTWNGPAPATASSGTFAIVAVELAITAPSDGAIWVVGGPAGITWSSNIPASETMLVELSRDGGSTFEPLAAAAPNTGSFAWTVTDSPSANAVARVTWNSPTQTGTSSAVFGIVARTVALIAPASGALVGAQVTVTATTNDTAGTTSMAFYDGETAIATVGAPPFTITWHPATGGSHSLTARATDLNGTVTTSVVVTITADIVAPTVALSSPGNGSNVQNTVNVSASASDNTAVSRVEFYLDGTILLGTGTTSPYSISWNTTLTPAGSHTLTAIAYDTAGNARTSASRTVIVKDVTKPTVAITSPAHGALVAVSSAVTITANASDLNGVSRVDFYVAGSLKCTDMAPPYECVWTVPATAGKNYNLQAKAVDAANNSGSSVTVTVTSQ
jgi:hypothetical protein